MGLTKLGLYIEQSDFRNADSLYGADSVVGLSTQKQIINTKADLAGVNLSSYKLMPPKAFAYVPDTSRRGDKQIGWNAGRSSMPRSRQRTIQTTVLWRRVT